MDYDTAEGPGINMHWRIELKTPCISLITAILLFYPSVSFSETKTFVREYTYEAGDMDSKISSRAIALEQVKRLLLEELGTYVESVSTVNNYQLGRDRITILSAGVVQTSILEEKWDGKTYWMKAIIAADPEEVAASIDQLRDKEQIVADLEAARAEASHAMAEVETLKAALADASAATENQARYDESIRQLQATDWFERGQVYATAGQYQLAAQAFNQVTVLKPNDARGYNYRGTAYIQLGNYRQAVRDFDRAVKLSPKRPYLQENRRIAEKMLIAPQQLTPREKHYFVGQTIRRERELQRTHQEPQELRTGQRQPAFEHHGTPHPPQQKHPPTGKVEQQRPMKVQPQNTQVKMEPKKAKKKPEVKNYDKGK